MNELIPIQGTYNADGSELQTANARDIHAALGVKKDFSNWVKDQIKRGMFEEDQDFIISTLKGENSGRPKKEYHFTIDAGKHIAMMSGTKKGREVRAYFIHVEKKMRSGVSTMTCARSWK